VCGRHSIDADDPAAAAAAVAMTKSCSSPPPAPPVTPDPAVSELSAEMSSDSQRHLLMKPLAERLRRLSTGSMHIDVATAGSAGASGSSPPVIGRQTLHYTATDTHSAAMSSGFRKCMKL